MVCGCSVSAVTSCLHLVSAEGETARSVDCHVSASLCVYFSSCGCVYVLWRRGTVFAGVCVIVFAGVCAFCEELCSIMLYDLFLLSLLKLGVITLPTVQLKLASPAKLEL